MLLTTRLSVAAVASLVLLTGCGSLASDKTTARGASPAADDGLAVLDPGTAVDGGTPASDGVPVDPGPSGTASPLVGAEPSTVASLGGVPALGAPVAVGGASGSTVKAPTATVTAPKPTVPKVVAGPTVAPAAPIRLGVVGVNIAALADQFGSDKKLPDVFDGAKRFIDYVNKNGGVAGHQIKPVFVRVDSASEISQAGQVACTTLTQDNTVDMVLSLGFSAETLYSCLRQKGISLFNTAGTAPDAAFTSQHHNVFLPTAMRLDRGMAAAIAIASRTGALKSGDKLGVLVESCAWGERIYADVVVPAARKLGVETEKVPVTCITNLVKDLGPVSNDVMRGALVLKAKGATHVLAVSAAEGFLSVMTAKVAATQQYTPKYIVTSAANLIATTSTDGPVLYPRDALKDVVGVGSRLFLDTGAAAKPSNSAQAAQQALCRKIDPTMGGAATATGETGFAVDGFYAFCDTVLAIKTVLENNGNKFGMADMGVGYRALLAKGVSAVAVGGRYGGGTDRRDGLSLVQALTWNAATSRMAYTGQVLAVP